MNSLPAICNPDAGDDVDMKPFIHNTNLQVSFMWSCKFFNSTCNFAFNALTLLVGWQEGHPACKNCVVGCWCGYLSGARCSIWPS